MTRNELIIRLFEAHSHFPSIANPPIPQISLEMIEIYIFQKIEKSNNAGIRRDRRQWAEPLYSIHSSISQIKGAPPIAADPGGLPDFRIFGFFGKC